MVDLSQFILSKDPFPMDEETNNHLDWDATQKYSAIFPDKKAPAMILDIDPGETFYKLLLDEKIFWFPILGCSLSTKTTAGSSTSTSESS